MDAITPVLAFPLTKPMPNIEPTETWVVETGMPNLLAKITTSCPSPSYLEWQGFHAKAVTRCQTQDLPASSYDYVLVTQSILSLTHLGFL